MSTSLSKTEVVTSKGMRLSGATELCALPTEPKCRLRLLILMARGTPGALPEAWGSYVQIEHARSSALSALRNPEVLRVGIVDDGSGLGGSVNALRLVEWVG